MFDLIPNLLSLPTILLPLFASYKALNANEITQLTPWLMYWVVLACFTLAESWLWWILMWVPFYAWARFLFLLYLSLPQTQGAKHLYMVYFHPYLQQHEHDIEHFIAKSHEQAMAAGLEYFHKLATWIQEQLGLPARPAPPPPAQNTTYAQNLFARFSLPSVAKIPAVPTGAAADFYGFLSSAVTAAAGSVQSREAQVENLSASGTLIPPGVKSPEDKMSFIQTQRDRLQVLLSALDREALNIDARPPSLPKNASEDNFERVERDELTGRPQTPRAAASWVPWGWSRSQPATPAQEDPPKDHPAGTSSGVDL